MPKVFCVTRYFTYSDDVWIVAQTRSEAKEKGRERPSPAVTEDEMNLDDTDAEMLQLIFLCQKEPIDPAFPTQIHIVASHPSTTQPVDAFYGHQVLEDKQEVADKSTSYPFSRWEQVGKKQPGEREETHA